MIRTNLNDENQLISSNYIEWRNVLSLKNNKQLISIEMMGTGSEAKIPAGILNICIQLMPSLNEPLKEDIVSAQIGLEYSKNIERERLFLIYTKQWWKEFLELREDHKNRYVKIFAQVY
jgi:centrosomal protein CEP76